VNYLYQTRGIGQFVDSTHEGEVDVQGWIEYIEVSIKTATGISSVVRITPELQGTYLEMLNLSPMLSYPDSRATKLTLYRSYYDVTEGRYFEQNFVFPLKASDTQNFAYYLDPNLKPINVVDHSIFTDDPIGIKSEVNGLLIYRNGLKVSLVNNPFFYPADQAYTVGTGFIRNIQTNALRMSEGQFGQYDLYVFMSDGIESFDTGTTLAYNRHSPASIEIPISNIVCSTPFGVIFIAKRGAYIMSGQKPEPLSFQIEEKGVVSNIDDNELSFLSFLETLKDILFDSSQNEIIFVGSEAYNYVLNLETRMFYTSTEIIDYEVKNAGEKLLVVADKSIKDFTQSETGIAQVAFTTRPFYFSQDKEKEKQLKKLNRSILRGKFYTLNSDLITGKPFLSWYGSHDGIYHSSLIGYGIPATKQVLNYQDFNTGLLTKSNFINYSVMFEAELADNSQIECIDFDVEDGIDNNKLR
jgi:hypothetical protein